MHSWRNNFTRFEVTQPKEHRESLIWSRNKKLIKYFSALDFDIKLSFSLPRD